MSVYAASILIRSYLAKHPTYIVPHPPYSPDLDPVDIFQFPKLKTTIKGCKGDSGKYDKRTGCHHRQCVPGSNPKMEETLGRVYRR
jgi:hypothetical protein